MRRALENRILVASRRRVSFGVTLAVALLAFGALLAIAAQFARATQGLAPFDLQQQLTVAGLLAQLELYTGRSYALYAAFLAVDMLFPLAAGVALAALVACGLRSAWPAAYASISARSLWTLLLIPTACDWLENLAGLGLILHHGGARPVLATALLLAKQAKLATLGVLWIMAAAALLAAGAVAARRAIHTRRSRGAPERKIG